MKNKPFLSVREVADYLDIDYKTIYRLVKIGDIPASKVGGVYRVRRADLEDYLENQKVKPMKETKATETTCAICNKTLPVPSSIALTRESDGAPVCHTCAALKKHKLKETEKIITEPDDDYNQAEQKRGIGVSKEIVISPEVTKYAAMESAFFARLESNILDLKTFKHPDSNKQHKLNKIIDGKQEITVFSDPKLMKISTSSFQLQKRIRNLPANLKAEIPHNRSRSYILAEPHKGYDGVKVVGQFWSPFERIISEGDANEPLDLATTRKIIDSYIEKTENSPFNYILGIASPTGFSDDCMDLVQGKSGKWKIIIPRLLLVLVNLVELAIFTFTDHKYYSYAHNMFSFEANIEQRSNHAKKIRALIKGEDSLSMSKIVSHLGIMPDAAEELMKSLAESNDLDLMRLSDGELVIYKIN